MALTLNAEQKSIYDIFSGENQYIIPPYQRAYSWTNIQCKALFEDIKKAFYNEEQEGYFLGNIVLAKSRENKNKLEVIDGQQRLTTLILLIKVLLSFDKENKALYNAIWIKDRRTDEEIQRLETNIFMEQDYNYFKEVLAFDFSDNICESINKEDNFFKQNICYLYNKLKEFNQNNDIFKFADFLLDKIYILPIETEDSNADKARKNALQVFETINNRGLNLSTSDIFKARLYSMALNEFEHEIFIERWKDLQNNSDKLNCKIDDIFRIYSYILQVEESIGFYPNLELKEFFLDDRYSPFLQKKQNIIMTDLLKICDFSIFFIDIVKDSKENQELTKWFQLIHQSILSRVFDSYQLHSCFYKSNLKDFDKLLSLSKSIVCDNFKGSIAKNKPAYAPSHSYEDWLLLGLYLNEEEQAISPYDFISKNSNSIFFIDKLASPYGQNIITIEELIKFYPKLKDINIKEKLRNKAYEFIGECNEN